MTYRILHVFDHSLPLHSGYTFRSRALLREQHQLGWETMQVTSSKQGGKQGTTEEQADGLTFFRTEKGALASLPLLNNLDVIHGLTRRIEFLVAEHKPNILHAHSPALNGVAALRVARRHNLPLVYEVRAFWEDAAVDHGTTTEGSIRYRMTHALESFVLRRSDQVTCICDGLLNDIKGRGIDEERITVIPNAVDASHFSVLTARDAALEHQLEIKDKCVLGFIGSFYHYEGIDLLLDALRLLWDSSPNLIVVLVGGGPQEAQLKEKAARLGIGSRVRFVGRVPHGEIHKYYSLIDLLVYPRIPIRLTDLVTPLKPLEAMAQGRLVLASNVGGHRELIRDGETGFLFDAGSVSSLAKSIESVFAVPEKWQGVLSSGRKFVEEERTWARSVDRYKRVYSSALQRGNRGT